ncbi:MAG: universal stress protein, partial [Acidobacteria bacterium]|nr:universal stress protein [Acidobacteriota bacterium]
MAEFAPRRILCPVDFSDYSAVALSVAGNLAWSFGAEIRVLHAQRVDAPVYFTSAQIQALKKQYGRSLRGARKFVEDFAARHLAHDVRRSVRLVEREPVDAILRMHKEWDADLVVMSTHGRTGLTRIRLGSVMESVLRQTTGPILTVGPPITTAPRPIRRILSPVNFSELSQKALAYSVDLGSRVGAEVTAMHVTDGPPAASRDAQAALCHWIPPAARRRCNLREVIREGKT